MKKDELKLLRKMINSNSQTNRESLAFSRKFTKQIFNKYKMKFFLFCSFFLVILNLLIQKLYLLSFIRNKTFSPKTNLNFSIDLFLEMTFIIKNENAKFVILNFFENLLSFQIFISVFYIFLFILFFFKNFLKRHSYFIYIISILLVCINLFIQTEIQKVFMIIIEADIIYHYMLSGIQIILLFSWQIFFSKHLKVFLLGILISFIYLFSMGFYIFYISIQKILLIVINLILICCLYYYIYSISIKREKTKIDLVMTISSLIDTIKSFRKNVIFFDSSGLSLFENIIEDDINLKQTNSTSDIGCLNEVIYENYSPIHEPKNHSTFYDNLSWKYTNFFNNNNPTINNRGISENNENNIYLKNKYNNIPNFNIEKNNNQFNPFFENFDYFAFILHFKHQINISLNINIQIPQNNNSNLNNTSNNLNYNKNYDIRSIKNTNNSFTYQNDQKLNTKNNFFNKDNRSLTMKVPCSQESIKSNIINQERNSNKHLNKIASNSFLNTTGKFINTQINLENFKDNEHNQFPDYGNNQNNIIVENNSIQRYSSYNSQDNNLKYIQGFLNSEELSSNLTHVLKDFNLNIKYLDSNSRDIDNESFPKIISKYFTYPKLAHRKNRYNSNPAIPNIYKENNLFNINNHDINYDHQRRINSYRKTNKGFNINNLNKKQKTFDSENTINLNNVKNNYLNFGNRSKTKLDEKISYSLNPCNIDIIEPSIEKFNNNIYNINIVNNNGMNIKNDSESNLNKDNSLNPIYISNDYNSGYLFNNDTYSKQNFSFAQTNRMKKRSVLPKTFSKLNKTITISRKDSSQVNIDLFRQNSNLISVNDILLFNQNINNITLNPINFPYYNNNEIEIIRNSSQNLDNKNNEINDSPDFGRFDRMERIENNLKLSNSLPFQNNINWNENRLENVVQENHMIDKSNRKNSNQYSNNLSNDQKCNNLINENNYQNNYNFNYPINNKNNFMINNNFSYNVTKLNIDAFNLIVKSKKNRLNFLERKNLMHTICILCSIEEFHKTINQDVINLFNEFKFIFANFLDEYQFNPSTLNNLINSKDFGDLSEGEHSFFIILREILKQFMDSLSETIKNFNFKLIGFSNFPEVGYKYQNDNIKNCKIEKNIGNSQILSNSNLDSNKKNNNNLNLFINDNQSSDRIYYIKDTKSFEKNSFIKFNTNSDNFDKFKHVKANKIDSELPLSKNMNLINNISNNNNSNTNLNINKQPDINNDNKNIKSSIKKNKTSLYLINKNCNADKIIYNKNWMRKNEELINNSRRAVSNSLDHNDKFKKMNKNLYSNKKSNPNLNFRRNLTYHNIYYKKDFDNYNFTDNLYQNKKINDTMDNQDYKKDFPNFTLEDFHNMNSRNENNLNNENINNGLNYKDSLNSQKIIDNNYFPYLKREDLNTNLSNNLHNFDQYDLNNNNNYFNRINSFSEDINLKDKNSTLKHYSKVSTLSNLVKKTNSDKSELNIIEENKNINNSKDQNISGLNINDIRFSPDKKNDVDDTNYVKFNTYMNNSNYKLIDNELNFNNQKNGKINRNTVNDLNTNNFKNKNNIHLKNNRLLLSKNSSKQSDLSSGNLFKNESVINNLNNNDNLFNENTKQKKNKLFKNPFKTPISFTNSNLINFRNICQNFKYKIYLRKNRVSQNLELMIKSLKEQEIDDIDTTICDLKNLKNDSVKICDPKNPDHESIVNLIDLLSNLSAKVCHEFRNPITNILGMIKSLKSDILCNQIKKDDLCKRIDINMNLNRDENLEKNTNLQKTILSSDFMKSDSITLDNLRKIKYLCHSINLTVSEIDLLSQIIKIGDTEIFKNKMIEKIKANAVEVDFRKEINFIYKIFENKITLSNKKIAFIVEIGENIPSRVKIDTDTLKKLLFIIIENSIKFSNTGQIKLSINLMGNFLSFVINDEGIGIKQTSLNLNKIGTLFFKEENGNNTYGLGLGLFIFKIYISALNGKFKIDSNLNLSGFIHSQFNTGTTVQFDLPIKIKDKKDYKLLINDQKLDSDGDLFEEKERQLDTLSLLQHQTLPVKNNTKKDSFNLEKYFKIVNDEYKKNIVSEDISLSRKKLIKDFDVLNSFANQNNDLNFNEKISNRSPNKKIYRNSDNDNNKKLSNNILNKLVDKSTISEKEFKLQINYNDIYSRIPSPNNSDRNSEITNNYAFRSSSVNNKNLIGTGDINNPESRDSILKKSIKNLNCLENIKNSNIYEDCINTKSLNILIVDDEEIIRKSQANVVKKFFKKNNLDVNIYEGVDGVEGLYKIYLAYMNGIKFDLIITDETMNFMKGSTMSKIIKNLVKDNILYDVKICMVTSYESTIIENIDNFLDMIGTKPLSHILMEKIYSKFFK